MILEVIWNEFDVGVERMPLHFRAARLSTFLQYVTSTFAICFSSFYGEPKALVHEFVKRSRLRLAVKRRS